MSGQVRCCWCTCCRMSRQVRRTAGPLDRPTTEIRALAGMNILAPPPEMSTCHQEVEDLPTLSLLITRQSLFAVARHMGPLVALFCGGFSTGMAVFPGFSLAAPSSAACLVFTRCISRPLSIPTATPVPVASVDLSH